MVSASSSISRRAFLAGLAAAATMPAARANGGVDGLKSLAGAELERAVRWAQGVGARLGASVVDLASGVELAAASPLIAENPASNQKLVTAGALLKHLGGQRTFATGLYGRPAGSELPELVLRGDGDPSLTAADIAGLVLGLRARGVQRVGKVLVDQSAFDEHFVPPGFEQQPHEWAAFRAPVSAVAVDRNSVLVVIEPTRDGAPARVSFEPERFVELEGRIGTGPRGRTLRAVAALAPRGDHLVAHLGGSVAEGSTRLRYRQRVDDPRLLAGYVLCSALTAAGIASDGTPVLGGVSERNELVVHHSRPLRELLPALGKDSDNFYAETLLKVMGGVVRGAPGSSAAGAEVAVAWLKAIGAWDAGTRITNGSGLFDSNRLSPRTLTRVLANAGRDPALGPDFVGQLAIGGVDGTLKERFKSLAARRAVLAKTGTLKDVASLGGYVVGPDHQPAVAFAFIASGLRGRLSAAREAIDRVVTRLAEAVWA